MTNRLGPYELNTIVTGECSALMATLPDGCIDLTVTSPPYDSLRTYSGYTFNFEPIARQLWRVTKEGGVVVWVVGDATENGSESGTSFRQALGFMAVGFKLHDTMIYNKGKCVWPDPTRYGQSWEYMFVFSKGAPQTVNKLQDRVNRWGGTKSFGTLTERMKDGSLKRRRQVEVSEVGYRLNIWDYASGFGNEEVTIHPAPFPQALARDHILSWSNPGDICLDPMVGSGTTAKQAHLLGRHYLSFDISEEYCELARRRLAGVEAQPFLMPVVSEVNGKPEQAKLMP